jgi:DNA-binding MarR family transcriptional regulator
MTDAHDTEQRIALAWRELRRGASGPQLRRHLLGPNGPDLEQAQIDALEVLTASPNGLPMSDFADAMHVDPSTATRAIERLERLGLAERAQADDDRRFVRARATAEGTRTMSRITRLQSVGMERLLADFGESEREEFASYLDRFVDSIDRLVAELAAEARDR